MKIKFLLSLFCIILLVACETKQDVISEIDRLKNTESILRNEISSLEFVRVRTKQEISSLNTKLKELRIYDSGRTPRYILKIHLKQSHFSLDISKHIKDAINAIDFELPVDKDFYNSVSVGTRIVDEFRTGSFILYGSIGDWEITVKDKEIR